MIQRAQESGTNEDYHHRYGEEVPFLGKGAAQSSDSGWYNLS